MTSSRPAAPGSRPDGIQYGKASSRCRGWDGAYTASAPAPWDIGRRSRFSSAWPSRGCCPGRCSTPAAEPEAHPAGRRARRRRGRCRSLTPGCRAGPRRAADRGLAVRFEVADALEPRRRLGLAFDAIIDSGVFHVFDDSDRSRYVVSLASALRDGGHCHLLCFSDRQPGTCGPAGSARTNCGPRSPRGGSSCASRRPRSSQPARYRDPGRAGLAG